MQFDMRKQAPGPRAKARIRARKMAQRRVCLYALCLMVCALLSTGATFSAYLVSDSAGSSAQVAGFKVRVSQNDNSVALSDGNAQGTHSFTVTNESEVVVSCKIIVRAEDPVPNGVSFSLGNVEMPANGESDRFEFDGGQLGIGESDTYELVVKADVDQVGEDYSKEIQVDVYVEQID